MSKESSYELLQSKRWRSITYNWDILSTYGQGTNLYCLSDFQVAWLLSNTPYMEWTTRWSNCPCTDEELAVFRGELDYALMSCVDIRPYEIQYLYNQAVAENFTQLDADYTAGGIPQVNPQTPTDFYTGNGSAERIDALCLACETYVKSYINKWQNQVSTLNLFVNVLLGLVGVIPILSDIVTQVVNGLVGVTQAKVDATNDPTAIDAVICCMRDALNAQPINATVFSNSLSACAFAPSSNNELVREIVASDLGIFDNWLSFIDALGLAFNFTDAGVEYLCPCIPITPSIDCRDYLNSQQSNTVLASSVVAFGTNGIEATEGVAGRFLWFLRLEGVLIDSVNQVEVTVDMNGATGNNTPDIASEIVYTYGDTTQETVNFDIDLPWGTSGQTTVTWNIPQSNLAKNLAVVQFRLPTSPAGTSGLFYTEEICLKQV